jgi:hypothetical protein
LGRWHLCDLDTECRRLTQPGGSALRVSRAEVYYKMLPALEARRIGVRGGVAPWLSGWFAFVRCPGGPTSCQRQAVDETGRRAPGSRWPVQHPGLHSGRCLSARSPSSAYCLLPSTVRTSDGTPSDSRTSRGLSTVNGNSGLADTSFPGVRTRKLRMDGRDGATCSPPSTNESCTTWPQTTTPPPKTSPHSLHQP